jgi:hypothetical protein
MYVFVIGILCFITGIFVSPFVSIKSAFLIGRVAGFCEGLIKKVK